MTRKFGQPRKETKQMAANTPAQAGKDAGAVSHGEEEWDSIDWNATHENEIGRASCRERVYSIV
jgi:hypothetical protein